MQQKFYKNFILFSAILGGIGIQNLSYADTATGILTVTANVATACTVQGGALDFQTIASPVVDSSNVVTTIKTTCASGVAYVISLDQGTGTGATTALRGMTSVAAPTGDTLKYHIYQAGTTTDFGNNPGVDTVAGTGTGVEDGTNVIGKILAADNTGISLSNGVYNDTVTITLTF